MLLVYAAPSSTAVIAGCAIAAVADIASKVRMRFNVFPLSVVRTRGQQLSESLVPVNFLLTEHYGAMNLEERGASVVLQGLRI